MVPTVTDAPTCVVRMARVVGVNESMASGGVDLDRFFDASKILGIAGHQSSTVGVCGCRDHQQEWSLRNDPGRVQSSVLWAAAAFSNCCGQPAIASGNVGIHCKWLETALDRNQSLKSQRPLFGRVGNQHSEVKFCQADRTDRNFSLDAIE